LVSSTLCQKTFRSVVGGHTCALVAPALRTKTTATHTTV